MLLYTRDLEADTLKPWRDFVSAGVRLLKHVVALHGDFLRGDYNVYLGLRPLALALVR